MNYSSQLNRFAIGLSIGLIMNACTSGKQEDKATEKDTMEMAATDQAATSAVEIKSFDNVDASVKAQINGFLSDYFVLNKALIEDNNEEARKAAKKLSKTVGKFDMSKLVGEQMDFYHTQLAKLNGGLKGIDKSADIEETRLELVPVSESMYALVKAYHPNSSELYYQFCPMAKNGEGANWLSETKEVVNPYMGQRMLKCGRTQETIN